MERTGTVEPGARAKRYPNDISYPGASKSFMIQLANPSAQNLTPKEIVGALDDAVTAVARSMGSRQKPETILFGPPDAPIPD